MRARRDQSWGFAVVALALLAAAGSVGVSALFELPLLAVNAIALLAVAAVPLPERTQPFDALPRMRGHGAEIAS